MELRGLVTFLDFLREGTLQRQVGRITHRAQLVFFAKVCIAVAGHEVIAVCLWEKKARSDNHRNIVIVKACCRLTGQG